MHVSAGICPEELEGLDRETWIFDSVWGKIEKTVGDALKHYLAESSEPDQHATPIEIVEE